MTSSAAAGRTQYTRWCYRRGLCHARPAEFADHLHVGTALAGDIGEGLELLGSQQSRQGLFRVRVQGLWRGERVETTRIGGGGFRAGVRGGFFGRRLAPQSPAPRSMLMLSMTTSCSPS